MGQPKEGVMMPDGRKMIEPIIAALSDVCGQIVIVGGCRGFSIPIESGLIHLPDTTPGSGPLAAILTLLQSGINKNGYIVTACDQPYITTDLIHLLVQNLSNVPCILKPSPGERLTPFPGYYPVTWRIEVEHYLQAGEQSLCRALEESRVDYLPFPNAWGRYLKNLNMPEDLGGSDANEQAFFGRS